MPIYEYKCNNCGHEYEIIQKISEDPDKKCPNCSKLEAVRLVSAPGFQLKGTGWYETDFKHKGKPSDKATPNKETSTQEAATANVSSTTSTTNTNNQGENK